MMERPIISIEVSWIKEPTTCEPCVMCDEPIYSDANVLYTIINDKKYYSGVMVCNSCYDAIEDVQE